MTKRNKKIYENCRVESPSGNLMFLAKAKRAHWYLDRNLAKLISKDPLTIRLNFEPKGEGYANNNDDYYLNEKNNRCVVCNSNEIELLTRHHIVPYEYRKHFPIKIKSRSSHDIVPICIEHHTKYENDHAVYLKDYFAEIFNAPRKLSKKQIALKKAYSYANALVLNWKKINSERFEEMIEFIEEITEEPLNDKKLKKLANINFNEEFQKKSHGKIVVSNFKNDLQYFVELWRSHFILTMQPEFMHKGWSIKRDIYS